MTSSSFSQDPFQTKTRRNPGLATARTDPMALQPGILLMATLPWATTTEDLATPAAMVSAA